MQHNIETYCFYLRQRKVVWMRAPAPAALLAWRNRQPQSPISFDKPRNGFRCLFVEKDHQTLNEHLNVCCSGVPILAVLNRNRTKRYPSCCAVFQTAHLYPMGTELSLDHFDLIVALEIALSCNWTCADDSLNCPLRSDCCGCRICCLLDCTVDLNGTEHRMPTVIQQNRQGDTPANEEHGHQWSITSTFDEKTLGWRFACKERINEILYKRKIATKQDKWPSAVAISLFCCQHM